jgi:hypothetical protein
VKRGLRPACDDRAAATADSEEEGGREFCPAEIPGIPCESQKIEGSSVCSL